MPLKSLRPVLSETLVRSSLRESRQPIWKTDRKDRPFSRLPVPFNLSSQEIDQPFHNREPQPGSTTPSAIERLRLIDFPSNEFLCPNQIDLRLFWVKDSRDLPLAELIIGVSDGTTKPIIGQNKTTVKIEDGNTDGKLTDDISKDFRLSSTPWSWTSRNMKRIGIGVPAQSGRKPILRTDEYLISPSQTAP